VSEHNQEGWEGETEPKSVCLQPRELILVLAAFLNFWLHLSLLSYLWHAGHQRRAVSVATAFHCVYPVNKLTFSAIITG